MNRILHPLASIELQEAAEWYDQIDPDLSEDFIHEFRNTAERVFASPYSFRIRDHGCRRINFHRFPFYLPYSIENDAIVILAVAHQSRKPGYWKNRVS